MGRGTFAESAKKLTVINGKIYDVTDFIKHHPGGDQLLSLAVQRDATIMFESYHMRDEMALKTLESLPQVTDIKLADLAKGAAGDFDPPPGAPQYLDKSEKVASVEENWITPGTSELYKSIRSRVRKEVLAKDNRQMGRGFIVRDAAAVIGYYLLSTILYCYFCNWWTALMLGWAGAWVGFALQHTANHGGLTTSKFWNQIWGLGDDIACGGSSLIWRYHHHVSHHAYTNVLDKDMDVYSSFPLMRFDVRQELKWFHKFQVIYAPISFALLYWSVQMQDWQSFLQRAVYDVKLLGLSHEEKVQFVGGKFLHYFVSLVIPFYFHGAASLLMFTLYVSFGSFVLAWLFIVSHNIEETKPSAISPNAHKDWAQWQIETTATWGGPISSFFTGGLNYQIEHHLFPSLAHNLYQRIQPIVKEECAKKNVPYHEYPGILSISMKLLEFLVQMGTVPTPSTLKTD
jgi:fatty acid desaturase (delta-4 desaturase)